MEKTAVVTDGRYRSSIAAVRALGREGWHVVVTETRGEAAAPPPVFASKYAGETRWISGSCRDPNYPDRLYALCKEYDRPVLFCVGAVTLNAVARERERFQEVCDFLIAPPLALDGLNDKESVHCRALELGLPVPREYSGEPDSYPVVVKPHCGEKFGLKAQDRYKAARGREEYLAALEALSPYDSDPIVQEKVEGDGFGASLLLDREGRLVCALCHRRVREYPTGGGPSACCESVYDPKRVDEAYQLLKSFGFVGAAMVEFKGDRLLEVNPRVWGSFPPTEKCGSPFAVRYAQAARGECPPYRPEDYRAGVRMRFLLNDTLAALSLWKQGRIKEGFRGLLDMFRAKEALRARDDPKPFRRYLRQTLRQTLRRRKP